MPFADLLPSFTLDQERLIWLGASLLLYVLGSVLAWMLSSSRPWLVLRTFVGSPLRFLYFVGVPYAALLHGTVTLPALGLIEVAETMHLRSGVVIAAGGTVAIVLWWWYLQHALRQQGGTSGPKHQPSHPTPRWDWVFTLIETGYQETHWAFYRALLALLLRDSYAGAFLALVISLVEMLADPATRYGLRAPLHAARFARTGNVAVLSTILFVVTGTSWVGATAHLVTVGAILWAPRVAWPFARGAGNSPSPRSPDDPPLS